MSIINEIVDSIIFHEGRTGSLPRRIELFGSEWERFIFFRTEACIERSHLHHVPIWDRVMDIPVVQGGR